LHFACDSIFNGFLALALVPCHCCCCCYCCCCGLVLLLLLLVIGLSVVRVAVVAAAFVICCCIFIALPSAVAFHFHSHSHLVSHLFRTMHYASLYLCSLLYLFRNLSIICHDMNYIECYMLPLGTNVTWLLLLLMFTSVSIVFIRDLYTLFRMCVCVFVIDSLFVCFVVVSAYAYLSLVY